MGKSVHRTTVSFTERSMRAIALAAENTGDSQADVINRAVQVYAYLTWLTAGALTPGATVIQARRPDGSTETVHLV
jgi:hypothetical protein